MPLKYWKSKILSENCLVANDMKCENNIKKSAKIK